MDQLTESKFNYNQLQPEIADFLKDKETSMRETVSNAYYQLGKELKEAQAKLAGDNQYNGVFQKWYESLGFSRSTVYRYIDYYDLVLSNWEDRKQIESLPKSLVYEIAKKSADPKLKQQVLDGDITSHKKYKELKKEKEEIERRKNQLEARAERISEMYEKERREKEELERKEPEVIERVEEVEVVPEDIQKRIDELEKRAGELEEHKKEVRDAYQKKQQIHNEIQELAEYKRKLKEENDLTAKRAEVVQGIRSKVNKIRDEKGSIEQLLKKDVQLRDVDLYNINEMADILNEVAEMIYDYVATQKSIGEKEEGEVINV